MKLCRCIACDLILEDKNPSDNAIEVDDSFVADNELEWSTDEFDDEGSGHWWCPACGSDWCLIDLEIQDLQALWAI